MMMPRKRAVMIPVMLYRIIIAAKSSQYEHASRRCKQYEREEYPPVLGLSPPGLVDPGSVVVAAVYVDIVGLIETVLFGAVTKVLFRAAKASDWVNVKM